MAQAQAVPWASATFAGARHELALELAPAARAARWLRTLPDAELPLPGQLVADLRIVSAVAGGGIVAAVIEVLTVEER